jgi:hypothetical protein
VRYFVRMMVRALRARVCADRRAREMGDSRKQAMEMYSKILRKVQDTGHG